MTQPAKHRISRRDVLRTAVTLGGLTVVTSFLEACAQVDMGTPTKVLTISAKPTATSVPSPSPTTSPEPTPTSGPSHVISPEPTSTSSPASATPPEPTSPSNPSPTAAPSPTLTSEPSPTISLIPTATEEAGIARVAFVKTRDRTAGVRRALDLLGLNPVQGNKVLLKPNFNSADPAPGSTHNDVLHALVQELWKMGAQTITVADRSGMGDTRQVMQQKGIFDLAQELGFETLVFDELEDKEWTMIQPPDSHWQRGFPFAGPCLEAEAPVQTCCLKTHRFGGQFTMSLKNSVGMVAKYGPDGYNYMSELHSSSHQRRMIAEINTAYTPALIVLDGVEAFVNQGPEAGQRVWTEVVLAGTDRVAIDAVGVALLRHFGTTQEVSQGAIFEQDQIIRAVELDLGVQGPEKIQFVTGDPESKAYAAQIWEILTQG